MKAVTEAADVGTPTAAVAVPAVIIPLAIVIIVIVVVCFVLRRRRKRWVPTHSLSAIQQCLRSVMHVE